MRKHPALIVLTGLLAGMKMSINGGIYFLDNGGDMVEQHLELIFGAPGYKPVVKETNISLKEFIKACEGISEDELATIDELNEEAQHVNDNSGV